MNMYQSSVQDVFASLNTSRDGLSSEQVKKQKELFGTNTLPNTGAQITQLKLFLNQWKSPLIIVLVIAAIVTGLLHEYIDMSVILITIGINILIGFFQENKANSALSKLRDMVTYRALVLRDGKKMQVDSSDLVPGDILFLAAGDKVQADARVVEVYDLLVDEAVLTGESEPLKKQTKKMSQEVSLADRSNMIYRGTTITDGSAVVVVTDIGAQTELGKIASLVKTTKDDQTPLQKQLHSLSLLLGMVVVSISAAIFIVGLLLRSDVYTPVELFKTAVAVAVAAIPEGLAIALTVILAIGMQLIMKRNAIVRRLVAAETLGSVSVICTDKTGTLTEGKMRASALMMAGDVYAEKQLQELFQQKGLDELPILSIAALCNNAVIEQKKDGGQDFFGDTTEVALLRLVVDAGVDIALLEKNSPRTDELAFDSKKKYMATQHRIDKRAVVYVKGAPEVLFEKATHIWKGDARKKITQKDRLWLEEQQETFSKQGYRMLAFAFKEKKGTKDIQVSDIDGLTIAGMVALSDPIREDVAETVRLAKQAGIHIVMITGDHAQTATAIAKQAGLDVDANSVIEGKALDSMSTQELATAIRNVSVFARVAPEDKIRIVQAFQEHDEVVAMTGDGVNDSPALKAADIGVALGSGTDVAKEVSDVVLLDDRFSTIVSAVEQGRAIYQNIKKVVLYLISGGFAEVLMVTAALIAGLPIPALPTQILWVNVIENVFPTIALTFDQGDKENMDDPPRRKREHIIDSEMRAMIIAKSILANIALFLIFVYVWKTTGDLAVTRTVVFIGFAIDSLFFVFSIRSLRHMIWQIPFLNNLYLLGAVGLGWILLVGAVYLQPLQFLLRTVALPWQYWVLMVGFGLFNIILIETIKWIFIIKKAHQKILPSN